MTKEELFEKNTLMAYKIANKYRTNYNRYYEDIKQEALLGLWRACQTYNESTKFSTYAYVCIKNTVNMYIHRLRKHEDRNISIYTITVDNLSIEDSLGAEDENIEQLEDSMILDEVMKSYNKCFRNDREKKVYKLFLNGKKQQEIGDIVRASQPVVSRIERRVTKRIGKIISI